ncbi:hypothetical protein Dimus_019052 [Dionaea muscipula]
MAGANMLFGSPNERMATTGQRSVMIVPIEPKPAENPKPRGRKSGGSSKQGNGSSAAGAAGQKKPQRGMGVEQLEKLRLQERWKKMTEINPSPPPPPPTLGLGSSAASSPAVQIQYQNHPYPYLDPTLACGIPVHLPKFAGFGPILGHGFPVQAGVAAATATGNKFLPPSGYQMGQCGGGVAPVGEPRGRFLAGFEGFRELPSIPKMEVAVAQQFDHHHHHDRQPHSPPGLTSKKKRVVNGHEKGYFREEICMENCYDQGSSVEVVAVHRKSNAAGRVGLLMEYGFFPREGSKGNMDNVLGSSCCCCPAASSSSSSSHSLPPANANANANAIAIASAAACLNMGSAAASAVDGRLADFSLFRGDGDPSIDLSLRL